MEIIWLGHSCFRLRSRDAVVVTDPFQKGIGYTLGRLNADIVTISHDHTGHNNWSAVDGTPHVVSGPGEYEIKAVMITGIRAYHDSDNGKQRGKNTVYVIKTEDLVICHLGDLGHLLTATQAEAMSNVDILFVPVGGNATLNSAQAAEVISLIEPKLVIPMHYRTPALESTHLELDSIQRFCREMGVGNIDEQPKLSLTSSSLPEETRVVLLKYRGA